MSSLKYIFVIEGNALVRKPKEDIHEQSTSEEKQFEEKNGLGEVKGNSSEASSSKPRNKRNKTSRGQ